MKDVLISCLRVNPIRNAWLHKRLVSFLSRFPLAPRTCPRIAGNGFRMTGDTNNWAFLLGYHEEEYMRFLGKHIKDRAVIYDIGANVGYLAFWLLNARDAAKEIKVYAFEPEPQNYQWLTQNCGLNPRLMVEAVPLAFGDCEGSIQFKTHGRGDGSARAVGATETSNPDNMSTLTVECVTLDYFANASEHTPTWLILDVEGYAGVILSHAIRTLQQKRPNVAVEIHDDNERILVQECLKRSGYTRDPIELRSQWGLHLIWLNKT